MNDLLKQVVQPPDDSIRLIPLTKGQVAIVDATDYEWLNQWKWHAVRRNDSRQGKEHYYAARHLSRAEGHKTVLMHRVIVNAPRGREVDHRDSDGLNNRQSNLRLATSSQNKCNSHTRKDNESGLKGVRLHKKSGTWTARICLHGKRLSLGYFHDKLSAAKAYEEAAKRLHGEFSRAA